MPNWCKGNIRFCGKLNDIIKLLENEIVYCKYGDEKENGGNKNWETITKPAIVTVIEDWEITIKTPFDDSATKSKSWCYINNTCRNFLNLGEGSEFESRMLYQLQKDKDKYIAVFDDFEAAWGIEPDPYVEMSKKYNVDIRIIGWEQGLGFWQDIVIIDGNLVRNVSDDYGDYDGWMWESALPYVGG